MSVVIMHYTDEIRKRKDLKDFLVRRPEQILSIEILHHIFTSCLEQYEHLVHDQT